MAECCSERVYVCDEGEEKERDQVDETRSV